MSYIKETCTQAGAWTSIFGIGILVSGIILVADITQESYHLDEFLQFYPNFEIQESQDEFYNQYISKWFGIAIVGICIGSLQIIGNAYLAKTIDENFKLWSAMNATISFTCLISLAVGFYFRIYLPRVGSVFLCLLGFNIFFIFVTYSLSKKVIQEAEKTTKL